MADGERREPGPTDAASTPSLAATVPADRIERADRASPDEPPGEAIRRGTAIRRYVVDGVVGAGAMGVVYAAHDRELDRKVALKLVRDPRRATARRRLLREAQALAQLSHPNVVAVYDVGTYRGQVFLAMEYVAGRTLRAWLAERPRSPGEILEVYRAAGQGLAAAHAAGIVHRDFKPDNVLVDDRGRARVADFGLAAIARGDEDGLAGAPGGGDRSPGATRPDDETASKAAPGSGSGSGRDLTATGAVLGTPAYMAPEQRAGAGPVDARADQFSFCVALYEALCGARPYEVADTVPAADRPAAATPPAAEVDARAAATRDLRGGRPARQSPTPVDQTAVAVPRAAPAAETAELAPFAAFVPLPPPGAPSSALAVRRLPTRVRRLLARGLCLRPEDRYPSMAALLVDLEAGIPARRHRRRVVAVAAVALGGAALAVALAARLDLAEEPSCRDAEDRLAGVWDVGRARAVRAAFQASRSPMAESAFGRLSGALDRWAAEWVAARTDACEATRVRGEQSASLLALRMDCLDRRAAEVAALVDVLSGSVDADAVAGAGLAASRLVPLSRCADREALTQAVPKPSEPARRERAADLERRLAAVWAQLAAVRIDPAAEAARELARDAAALAHRPLEAEAFQLLAEAEERAGDLAAAEDAYYHAIAAGEAGRLGRTTASAWIDLADLVGVRAGRRQEGRRLARLAQGAVDRLEGDQELIGELEQLLGDLALAEGEAAGARPHLERAAAIAEQVYGPDSPKVARALGGLGEAHLEANRPDRALAALERAVSIHDRAAPSPAEAGEVRFLLARALWDAGRDRPRALRLAAAARVELDRAGSAELAAEVGTWIQVRH